MARTLEQRQERALTALLLRGAGLKWREVGAELGVTGSCAARLAKTGGWLFAWKVDVGQRALAKARGFEYTYAGAKGYAFVYNPSIGRRDGNWFRD